MYFSFLLIARIVAMAVTGNISKLDVQAELEIVWVPGLILFLLTTIVDAFFTQNKSDKDMYCM